MVPWLTQFSHLPPPSLNRITKTIHALEAKIVELLPPSLASLSDADADDDEEMEAPGEQPSNEIVFVVKDPGVSALFFLIYHPLLTLASS